MCSFIIDRFCHLCGWVLFSQEFSFAKAAIGVWMRDCGRLSQGAGIETHPKIRLMFNFSGQKLIADPALTYPPGDAVEILGFFPGGSG
jgi:hypothetical protein